MSARESFERIYAEVCQAQGWIVSGSQVDVKFADGRHQIVHLEFFEHAGQPLVRFHSVIGDTKQIRQDRIYFALELNYSLPHGCLAVHGDLFVMVDTLLLEDVDAPRVEAHIRYLAETSDYYERTMFGPDAY